MRQFLLFALSISCSALADASEPSPQEIFDQRILPIFRSENPSSCVQCHLSSVDLKDYILPSQEATFVSLRDQGLIDLDAPSKSKILQLIRMGEQDQDEGARLIHEDIRTAEYEAFAAWVQASSLDPGLRALPTTTQFARPEKADAIIKHARKSRIVDSFARNVWSQRMRCFPCHTPHEIDPDNPKHKAAIKKQKEFAEQYGESMVNRLNIFRETPEETLAYLIEASRAASDSRLPLINLEAPAKSLLVLKPTARLPKKIGDKQFESASYVEPVSHMGGLKMHVNDQSYKSFVAWIQDYARVANGSYMKVDQLPADNWFPSKKILRVKAVPADWEIGSPVQLFVHEWSDGESDWSEQPVAFTQGTVTPRRFVNGALFLLGIRSGAADETRRLEKGKRYLVRAYVDGRGAIADDPAAMLTKDDFRGEAEVVKPRWREGFRFAEVVDGGKLSTPE